MCSGSAVGSDNRNIRQRRTPGTKANRCGRLPGCWTPEPMLYAGVGKQRSRDCCAKVRQHGEDAPMILIRLGQPELSEDRADVRLDGSFREPELLRDARVRTPFRHQSEDLALSRS